MKTLYLVRHGKSSWEDLSLEDYERPLLPRGEKRTKKVADFLLKKSVKPDLIISSQAVRAFETASIIADELGYGVEKIEVNSSLYFSGAEAMENVVFGLPDEKKQVMLVGHNPDMTRFANWFLDEKVDYLSTSSVVCVHFHTQHWNEIMLAPREVGFVISHKCL